MNMRVIEQGGDALALVYGRATSALCDASVLHVTGPVTQSLFSFLGPTTEALQRAGVPQTVVAIDAPACREQLDRFAPGVELLRVPQSRAAWRHWAGVRQHMRERLARGAPSAVHFHGPLAWLAGAGLVRGSGTTVFVSPHGARLSRSLLGSGEVALATSVFDLHHLEAAGIHPLFVEGAIPDAYFEAERHEARRPLIVAGTQRENPKAIDLFCRAAVIFGDAKLGVGFNWFGPASAADAARLQAASIGSWPALADDELALRLGAGWVYFATGAEPDFPVMLVKAMAAGMPCLVAEAAAYQGLVAHEESGLVYRGDDEALEMLTALIDDQALRRRLGAGARAQALRRFTRQRLENELAWVYAR